MKKNLFIHSLLPASLLILGTPFAALTLRAETVDSAVADAKSDAIKMMLKDLDTEIKNLDQLEDNAPTPEERVAAKDRLALLKKRRNDLRKDYVQAKYDGLKADVKAEYEKASAWTKKNLSDSPEAKIERKSDEMTDQAKDAAQVTKEAKAKTVAATTPAAVAVATDIVTYKTAPTPENKDEVKAALISLDIEIDRLEQRCEALPKGDDRDAAKLRIKALKQRRSDLASDFRKARFDALMNDIKAEWHKITS